VRGVASADQAIAAAAPVGYNRVMRSVLAAIIVLGAVLAFAVVPPALAHDVDCTAASAGRPAGVDLPAVCSLDASTGRYVHGHAGFDPALGMLALFGGIGVAGIGALGWRILGGRAERRRALTTTASTDWWQCGACGSLNQPNRASCYSCRRAYDSSAARMPGAATLD
jgi:hypothetical protein